MVNKPGIAIDWYTYAQIPYKKPTTLYGTHVDDEMRDKLANSTSLLAPDVWFDLQISQPRRYSVLLDTYPGAGIINICHQSQNETRIYHLSRHNFGHSFARKEMEHEQGLHHCRWLVISDIFTHVHIISNFSPKKIIGLFQLISIVRKMNRFNLTMRQGNQSVTLPKGSQESASRWSDVIPFYFQKRVNCEMQVWL